MSADDNLALAFLSDFEQVTRLISSELPEFSGHPVRLLGEGQDHSVFAVGEEWIVRFPKRDRRVPWLVREVAVMAAVAKIVGWDVPRLERFVGPTAAFPFPFAAYRRVFGIEAHRARIPERAVFAKDVGRMLDALHRVQAEKLPASPTGAESRSLDQDRDELITSAEQISGLLGPDLLDRARPYLAGTVPVPHRQARHRFIHGDLKPEHLIVNPATGRLTGVIDLTDAMIADPAVDFVGLIGLGGRAFLDQVLTGYELPLGRRFDDTWEWLARTRTLCWLADAARDNPDEIPKHLQWVRNAFDLDA